MTAPTLFDFMSDDHPSCAHGRVVGQVCPFCNPLIPAAQAKEAAITQAEENADPDWKDRAYEALSKVARMRIDFTADEVWDELAGVEETTHEPSALGHVFLRASREGLIQKTGEFRLSRQTQRHRDLTVWRAA